MRSNPQRCDLDSAAAQRRRRVAQENNVLLLEIVEYLRVIPDELGIGLEYGNLMGDA